MSKTVTNKETKTLFDLIVLGAGPAGLTAALYAARAQRSVLVLDTGTVGGQTVLTHAVANYPGTGEVSGRELSQTMLAQVKSFGGTVKPFARITEVNLEGTLKKVGLKNGTVYEAPVVIVATGGVPRKLGVEGEDQFFGQGISYCATCDGEFFTDRPIAVVGGGNSALEEAVALSQFASDITVLHEFDEFQAEPHIVEQAKQNPKISFLTGQEIQGFAGDPGLSTITSKSKSDGTVTNTPIDGAFVFIGYVPNTGFLDGQVKLNDAGYIVTDDLMATNVPGVYAAGDVRVKRDRQITTAVSDGTVAALSALSHLGKIEG